MTVYAWWFMFIGWLIHPLDTTVLGCIPAYLPTRKIIDAFSYLLPRCPFERQERAKMLQKFKQHIDGISGPLEQHFTQHHLFHWKSSNLNLLGNDEDIGSKLNEQFLLLQNPQLYFCFTCAFAAYHGKLQKIPKQKSPTLLPVAPNPEVKVKQHQRRLRRWKSRFCEEMPPFLKRQKRDRGVGDVEGKDLRESRSIHVLFFFFGKKQDESLLKLLEHVGKNCMNDMWNIWKYDWMTTRIGLNVG